MSAVIKTTRKEQGEVYVGVWAQPTPPHIPVLPAQLTFFSALIHMKLDFLEPKGFT